MQKHRVLGYGLGVSLFFVLFAQAKAPQEKLPIKKINVCGQSYKAWVAEKDEDRARGLMNFRELKKDEAMIFVFQEEEPLSFWMKNVPYDLDIAYFNADKKLVSVTTMKATSPVMKAESLPSYPSASPAQYAVEARAGSFKNLKKNCLLVY